jgi:lipopolysaccharide transport system ATP-binding protein
MSDVVIRAEGVSKLYRLGEIGTGTLSHDLKRWWARARGQEDPFAQIGVTNDRTQKGGESEYVWSLRDVNFEVRQGEVLGIIGRNGAGKSTLLKILSKVTTPTEGRIRIKGRIASLLEVGTGFHPELTGRENIFLNGAILGMSKAEIRAKFDEIVDFSGVERYIDTPVKRYSSGMYVRLAFAVAAFLEPEILIVDEVLAVGDAEFQKKCLGRMQDVSKNDGRTVLFVSHNMTAVKQLCNRAIALRHGQLVAEGEVQKIVDEYIRNSATGVVMTDEIKYFTEQVVVNRLTINDSPVNNLTLNHRKLVVAAEVTLEEPTQLDLDIHIKQEDVPIASFGGFMRQPVPTLPKGRHRLVYELELPSMRSGQYQVDIYFTQPYARWWGVLQNVIDLEIHNTDEDPFLANPNLRWGTVQLEGHYRVEKMLTPINP